MGENNKKALYRDIRFEFLYDNPFHDDKNRKLCKELTDYMDTNLALFSSFNFNGIRFTYIKPTIKKLFDVEISENLEKNPLVNEIKDFLASSKLLPESLKKYGERLNYYRAPEIETQTGGTIEAENDDGETLDDEPQNEPPQNEEPDDAGGYSDDAEEIIPLISNKFAYTKTSGLTNYDITTYKLLSYDEIRKITTNIARSELVPNVQKDEYRMRLEEEKRAQLMEEINQFRKIRDIGAISQDDVSKMTLTQLNELMRIYQKAYNEKKLYTVFRKGGNILETISGTLFPNGIRISRDPKTGNEKYIQTNGCLKEITDQLFDTGSCVGLAAQRLLKDSGIKISDSILTVIALGEIVISNIKIVDVKREEPQEQPQENDEQKGPIIEEPEHIERTPRHSETDNEDDNRQPRAVPIHKINGQKINDEYYYSDDAEEISES